MRRLARAACGGGGAGGFFLIEVLVALALVAIVAVAAVRLAAAITEGASRRRDLVRSLHLARAVESDLATAPRPIPGEGGFDLYPQYRYRLRRDPAGRPESVTILGPRGARTFLLAPPRKTGPSRRSAP